MTETLSVVQVHYCLLTSCLLSHDLRLLAVTWDCGTGRGLNQILHNELHWLDVPQCVTFKLCTTVYKCLHGLAPKYLADLCVPVAEVAGRCQLCSASRGLLDFPRFNMSNYGRRVFSFAGPHTWNSLPDQLWTSASLATFKHSLKTFLFEQITHLAH